MQGWNATKDKLCGFAGVVVLAGLLLGAVIIKPTLKPSGQAIAALPIEPVAEVERPEPTFDAPLPRSRPAPPMGTFIRQYSRPKRFISGHLVCAINVNSALAERGIRGTRSALAKSFLHWGRSSKPVPGAVAVFTRGDPRGQSGHVAIVSRVKGSTVFVWNPGRKGWKEVVYRKRAIAYRVPT